MRRPVHLGMSLLLACLLWACVDSGPACLNPQPDLPSCSQGSVAAAPGGSVPAPAEGTGGSAAIDLTQGSGTPPAATGSFATGGSPSAPVPGFGGGGLDSAGAHQGGAAGGPAIDEVASAGSAGRATKP